MHFNMGTKNRVFYTTISIKECFRNSFIRRFKKSIPYYLIILLPVVYLIVFKYVPMYGVQIAFREFSFSKGILGSPWIGTKYFEMFFNAPSFWIILYNTISINIYGLVAGFPLAIILAIAFNECRHRRFSKTVQMVTYMPYFISTVILVSMILQFTDIQSGWIIQLIKALGGKPVNIMSISEYFKSIYVWTGIWQGTGYSAVVYLAALAGISIEQKEAAIIDGASKFQRIFYIDFPGIAPTITILLTLSMAYMLNIGFEKIYLMQNNLNLNSSEVISTYVYKVGLVSINYSFSSAISFFNSVVNLILLLGFNKFIKRIGQTGLW